MLLRMNRWDTLIAGPRAGALRGLLCRAAAIAHTENGARHAPEDLGDDALIYGICTTNSARHVAARFVEDSDVEGVAVRERGRVWWLEIKRPEGDVVRLYFYKAPPGSRTVWDVRLDDTEIKKELSSSNGHQLELFNRAHGNGYAQLLNIIVVHYGDPLTGLHKLEIGAPYIAKDGIAWDWHERFDTVEPSTAVVPVAATTTLGDDDADFAELRLVTPSEDGDADSSAEDAQPEQATSEFEALGLREDTDAGTGEEPT